MILEPYFVSQIMNSIQQHNGVDSTNLNHLLSYLGGMVAVTLLFWSFHGPARVMETNNAFRVRRSYRDHFLKGILGLPMQWHNDHNSGETVDRVDKGTTALYSFSEDTFEIIYTFTRLIISYVVLTYFSFTAGLIALFYIAISVLITIKIDKTLIVNYAELSKAENATATNVFETLKNITTVIILRVEKHVHGSIMKSIDDQTSLTDSTNRLNELKWFFTSLMCSLMTFSVLGHYFWSKASTGSTVLYGSVFLLYSYLEGMGQIFFRFTGTYSNLVKQRVRAANADGITTDFRKGELDTRVLPIDWQEIEIRGLSFAYPETDKQHLIGVDLKLKRGQKVAFVGYSGSGKSTTLKLMRGLHQPDAGTVVLDGKICPDKFLDFGDSVALMPQTPEIFDQTIRYNLTLGAEYTEEQIAMAIHVSCLKDVINRFPKGIETSVKERGVKLSIGEVQRLAIARGLLASIGKGIVLLDEPTSSLDAWTENIVLNRLLAKMDNRLVVCVTHKLQVLDRFDVVIMFEHGQVVGMGTTAELLENCPAYKRLIESPEES
jgi:ABC-type multidrug transport system fused ATPase/permease subunit